ncbi:MAG: META domain-containing protein [Oscillochloridaceae bacterium]|nr:META domain-containing protein [Chloroflexaceae bacterium]MDW8391387.1 META domain-containing protein [Oscillochloridaceae bacterium]
MASRMVAVILAMATALALTACGVGTMTTTATESPLGGTSWLLESLNGAPPLPDTQVTLNFEADGFAGTDGCNQYRGSYQVNGERITIKDSIASTMMACPEPIMQQATAYYEALKQAASFKVDGQQLTLLSESGEVTATFVAQSRALSGTSWTVTGYNNGKQAVVSVLNGSTLTLVFGADGQLSGSAGCNNYTGSYEVADQSLRIGPLASTKRLCNEPEGVMEQETQFLEALGTAVTYRIDGDRLELRTGDGAMAVTAVRAAPAAATPAGARG